MAAPLGKDADATTVLLLVVWFGLKLVAPTEMVCGPLRKVHEELLTKRRELGGVPVKVTVLAVVLSRKLALAVPVCALVSFCMNNTNNNRENNPFNRVKIFIAQSF